MNLSGFDTAIVDHLDALSVGGNTRAAALADVPSGSGWRGEPGVSAFRPYITVWPTDANRDGLMLSDPHTHVEAEWVVKGAAATAAEAKAITDAALTRLTDVAITPPSGIAVVWVRHVGTSGPYPDHDTTPEVFVAACTVAFRLQAA